MGPKKCEEGACFGPLTQVEPLKFSGILAYHQIPADNLQNLMKIEFSSCRIEIRVSFHWSLEFKSGQVQILFPVHDLDTCFSRKLPIDSEKKMHCFVSWSRLLSLLCQRIDQKCTNES